MNKAHKRIVAAADPTNNVTAMVGVEKEHAKELRILERRRTDDLQAKDREISDIQHKHQESILCIKSANEDRISGLREGYQEKIQHAESGRLDSIRQVDREEVAKTAVAANTAITVLANRTAELALTLDKKVSDTAAAAEARGSTQYSDTNKRLSALELSSSEGKGKQTVSDPQMEKLTEVVAALARSQVAGTAESKGFDKAWAIVVAIIGIGIAIYSKLP